MTKWLYDEQPYETKFFATVLSCAKMDAGYALIFNQTLFFPEQGGQTADQGVVRCLSDDTVVEVTDVQMVDGEIYHYTHAPIAVGEKIEGRIDWEKRFDKMQQHTGEHIFSGLVCAHFGYENVGFHLSDTMVTMDYNGKLSEAQAREMEALANRAIWENHRVHCFYPTSEELAQMTYRSKKELTGAIRIVQIADVDVCACCAPHVHATAEVGLLKVLRVQNYKGGSRLSIACGKRALSAFVMQQDIVARLKHMLSAGEEDLPVFVERLQSERAQLQWELNGIRTEKVKEELQQVAMNQDALLFVADDVDVKILRKSIEERAKMSRGLSGVFVGDAKRGYTFILASKNIDCRKIACDFRDTLGAKCGGQSTMIQGSVRANPKEITELLHVALQ